MQHDTYALPFPPSLVFPDVDATVLDSEGAHEAQASQPDPMQVFLARVLGPFVSSSHGHAQSAASA